MQLSSHEKTNENFANYFLATEAENQALFSCKTYNGIPRRNIKVINKLGYSRCALMYGKREIEKNAYLTSLLGGGAKSMLGIVSKVFS